MLSGNHSVPKNPANNSDLHLRDTFGRTGKLVTIDTGSVVCSDTNTTFWFQFNIVKETGTGVSNSILPDSIIEMGLKIHGIHSYYV